MEPRWPRHDWLASASEDDFVKVRALRYFSAHHMMMRAANAALPNASNHDYALVAILLSAMAAEALANAVGGLVLQDVWKDIEPKLSPWGKFRLICRELKIPCKGVVEWERLHQLLRLRNDIAHAKPEQLDNIQMMTLRAYGTGAWNPNGVYGASELEKDLTQEKAREAVQTFENILSLLVDAVQDGIKFMIDGDCSQHFFAPLDANAQKGKQE